MKIEYAKGAFSVLDVETHQMHYIVEAAERAFWEATEHARLGERADGSRCPIDSSCVQDNMRRVQALHEFIVAAQRRFGGEE